MISGLIPNLSEPACFDSGRMFNVCYSMSLLPLYPQLSRVLRARERGIQRGVVSYGKGSLGLAHGEYEWFQDEERQG
jgi:hypothetical protein